MKYEEKFNKYLQGTLDKEASEEIETDIEKMQVLLEHMDIEPEEALSEEEIPERKRVVSANEYLVQYGENSAHM